MAVSTNQLGPIPYRTPLVDQQGLMSSPWVRYFQTLWDKIGGSGNGTVTSDSLLSLYSSDEIASNPAEAAGALLLSVMGDDQQPLRGIEDSLLSLWPEDIPKPSSSNLFTSTLTNMISGTTGEISFIVPGVGSNTIHPGLWAPGKSIKLTIYSNLGSTGVNIETLRIYLGSTLLSSNVLSLYSTTGTLTRAEYLLTCQAAGTSGKIQASGHELRFEAAATSRAFAPSVATIDLTHPLAIDATFQFSVANIGNFRQVLNVVLEVI